VQITGYVKHILRFCHESSSNRNTQPWCWLDQQNLKEKEKEMTSLENKMKEEHKENENEKNKTRKEEKRNTIA
jgi:hypothetical protein